MANPKSAPLPSGNDPRLRMDAGELEAANRNALPQVGARSAWGDNLTLIAGMAGVLGLGVITFMTLGNTPSKPTPQPAPVQTQAPPPSSVLGPVNPDANPPVDTPPQSLLVPPSMVQPNPAAVPAPAATPVDTRSPTLIVDNSSPPTATPAAPAATQGAGATVTLNANDSFASRINGEVYQKAQKIGDPSKIVPQGAVIPAVLETAINSDLPGYTRAIVSRDIRSFDGSTVLIPRGSRLVGQYKSGLTSGETRAFIIWNRLIRPDGVSVQLASPGTDDLGQAGMAGKVDSHFAKRFGAAMLLSIVNGLSSGLSGKNSSTIVIGSAGDAQGVIGEALSNDAKIPPTIKVRQGALIQVFAARDLDFQLGN